MQDNEAAPSPTNLQVIRDKLITNYKIMKKEIKQLREEFNKKLDDLENKLSKEEIKWTRIGDLEWSEDLGEMNWYDAVEKCEELGGRLPTRVELMDLYDNHRDECKDFVANLYWSSTEDSAASA